MPLCGCIGLALDGFRVIASDVQLRNNAEYAAMAALREFKDSGNAALAVQRAEAISGVNLHVGAPGVTPVLPGELASNTAGSVTIGTWQSGTGVFTPGATPSANAVQIELNTLPRSAVAPYFARVIGAGNVNLKGKVMEIFDPGRQASGAVPYILYGQSLRGEPRRPADLRQH